MNLETTYIAGGCYWGLENLIGQIKGIQETVVGFSGGHIDDVTYNDVLPWPEEADGDGSLLQLSGLGLDNSLASNWTAINDIAGNLSVNSVQVEPYVVLSPNPVSDLLTLKISLGEIHNVKLYSLNGKLVKTYTFNQSNVEVDLSAFENGLYLLQIQTNTNLLHKKIIKI